MHTADLIANAIRKEITIPEEWKLTNGICCITGKEGIVTVKKNVLSSLFSNDDIMMANESQEIGINTAIALKYHLERQASWYVDEKEFIKFEKKQFRDFFLNGIKSKSWSMYITTSYKKHGCLFTKVNTKEFGIWRFENINVNASNKEKNNEWYAKISDARIRTGLNRDIIESLICPTWLIVKIGIDNWNNFYAWAKDKYQSSLYKLCCYMLPNQEEIKGITNEI